MSAGEWPMRSPAEEERKENCNLPESLIHVCDRCLIYNHRSNYIQSPIKRQSFPSEYKTLDSSHHLQRSSLLSIAVMASVIC